MTPNLWTITSDVKTGLSIQVALSGDVSIATARRFFSRGLQSWSNTLQTISRQALIVMDEFSTLEYRLPGLNHDNNQPFEGRLALILKQIAGVIGTDNPITSVTNLFGAAPKIPSSVNDASTNPIDFAMLGTNNNYTDFLGYDFSNGGSLSDTFGESPATGASSQSFDWSAFLGEGRAPP